MTREEFVRHLWWRYPVWRKKRRIFLAAFPKSGSTFLANVLGHLLGGVIGFGGKILGRNKQDLAAQWLWSNQGKNSIAHQHVRYSEQTCVYMDHFKLDPVIRVRSLADVISSIVDHWRVEPIPDSANWPCAHIHPHLMSQSEVLYDFAAVHVIPWYHNFYVGWVRYGRAMIIVLRRDILTRPRGAIPADASIWFRR